MERFSEGPACRVGMAVYQADTLSERPIYGSSRLGNLSYASKPGYRTVGHKQYELSNHLGNVLAVVSDRIRMKTDSTWTQVLSRTDGSCPDERSDIGNPFGLEMTGRTESATYRYGFNGKGKDPSGQWSNQSHYDYGFRIYNPTIGKFLSVDPLAGSFAMLTPFQYASNNPIYNIDMDGLEGMSYEQKMLHKGDDEWYATIGKFAYNTLISAGNSVVGTVNFVVDPKQGFSDLSDGVSALVGSISRDIQDPTSMLKRGRENISDIGRWEDLTDGVASMYFGGRTQLKVSKSVKLIDEISGLKPVVESTSGWSKAAKSYQEFVTGIKAGNAFDLNGVRFDGIRGNVLLEAKSSYDNFIDKNGEFYSWFKGRDSLIDQAQRQIVAADGFSVEWNFSSKKTLDATKKLFDQNGVDGIKFKYNPQK